MYLRLGYTTGSEFSVVVDKEYEVFAMSLWCGAIQVLLADEYHLPNWFPLEIFELCNLKLPGDWFYAASLHNTGGLQSLWGYERLITDPSHYDGLLERDPDALRHFYEEEGRWRDSTIV